MLRVRALIDVSALALPQATRSRVCCRLPMVDDTMSLLKPTTMMCRVVHCLLLLCLSALLPVAAQEVSYAWHNVRIGGGGYVSGLVFHPAAASAT